MKELKRNPDYRFFYVVIVEDDVIYLPCTPQSDKEEVTIGHNNIPFLSSKDVSLAISVNSAKMSGVATKNRHLKAKQHW